MFYKKKEGSLAWLEQMKSQSEKRHRLKCIVYGLFLPNLFTDFNLAFVICTMYTEIELMTLSEIYINRLGASDFIPICQSIVADKKKQYLSIFQRLAPVNWLDFYSKQTFDLHNEREWATSWHIHRPDEDTQKRCSKIQFVKVRIVLDAVR